MGFAQLTEITERCEREAMRFWQVIQAEDCRERDVTPERSFADMREMYRAMQAADQGYDPKLRSASGMAGGDGEKIWSLSAAGESTLGDYLTEVMERALKMAESNACMKRIVAAPTAGSCGVIPAVLLKLCILPAGGGRPAGGGAVCGGGDWRGDRREPPASLERKAAVRRRSGPPAPWPRGRWPIWMAGRKRPLSMRAALAMKSLLGLTCDPVAGLVEVPCIKRNASGAVNAVVASQMALAGIRSAIPPDEVIDSMRRIGHLLPACLRETGQEGLATTPTGLRIQKQMSQA